MIKAEKLKQNNALKISTGFLFSFLGGFIFSGSSIAGVASFVDISLAGSLSLPFSAAVFAGGIVRCVLTDSIGRSIIKLAAMSVIVIAKMFFEKSNNPKICGIITSVAVIIAGAAVSLLINEFPQKLMFYALYGMIAGFTS